MIDNALQLRRAKVMMNMDHDAFYGDLPTGLYYMELILANYKGSDIPLEMVALLHDKGAYMVLNDAAYNRLKHRSTGNTWKVKIVDLQKVGIPSSSAHTPRTTISGSMPTCCAASRSTAMFCFA